jgi:glucokinase
VADVKRLLGIDIGVTKIAAAVVDPETGETSDERWRPTRPERGGAAVLSTCVELAEQAADACNLRAIGLGICELVDLNGDVTTHALVDWDERTPVEWDGLDLAQAFRHIAPIHVESDVRAAALAEARFGAGQGYRSFFYVNVGSGLSSCLVLGGVPYAGARGNAIILGGGPLHVERLASGVALAARYGSESAEEVSAAAVAGEERARNLLHDAGGAVGGAIAFAVNLLDPEAVVVGGGVALNGVGYLEQLEHELRANVWARDTAQVPLVRAELGSRAGLIGAGLAAAASPGVAVAAQ